MSIDSGIWQNLVLGFTFGIGLWVAKALIDWVASKVGLGSKAA